MDHKSLANQSFKNIRLSSLGKTLKDEHDAKRVVATIEKIVNSGFNVMLIFSDVNKITQEFSDAVFTTLMEKYTYDYFKKYIRLKNIKFKEQRVVLNSLKKGQ